MPALTTRALHYFTHIEQTDDTVGFAATWLSET